MNLDFLQTFIEIVRFGSITRAAEELGFSQPAVTKQLQALEQEFNAELFERGQKKLKVTKAGEIMETYAREIINLVDKAKYDITKLNKTVSGRLKIAASTIPGHYILPFIAGEFYKKYSQVHLVFESCDSEEVIKKVLDKSVQVGAVGTCPNNPQLICRKFFTDQLILIASPQHEWGRFKQITLNELEKGDFIWREKGSGTRQSIEKILEKQGVDVSRLKISMELGSTESVIKSVEAGYGISFVSRWSVLNELQLKKLKQISIVGFNGERDLYLIFSNSDFVPLTIEAFVDFATSSIVADSLMKYLGYTKIP